jgi:Protein of unknown function (DUF3759)
MAWGWGRIVPFFYFIPAAILMTHNNNPGLTRLPTDESEDASRQVYNDEPHHKGKFSHELIGGAVGFEAMKAYEDHERKNGTYTGFPFLAF